jgi:hypothetical protein
MEHVDIRLPVLPRPRQVRFYPSVARNPAGNGKPLTENPPTYPGRLRVGSKRLPVDHLAVLCWAARPLSARKWTAWPVNRPDDQNRQEDEEQLDYGLWTTTVYTVGPG